ncbi:MAG: Rid family detoxifying hydrolase [Pseudomonadota bacterium]
MTRKLNTRQAVDLEISATKDLPFSPAVHAGKALYLSGQVGVDPESGALVRGGVRAEVEQIFRNIAVVLAAAGKDVGDVVKANVYLAHMDDYAAMNDAYSRAFEKPYPARTCVGVAALPLGARVEIEVIAR